MTSSKFYRTANEYIWLGIWIEHLRMQAASGKSIPANVGAEIACQAREVCKWLFDLRFHTSTHAARLLAMLCDKWLTNGAPSAISADDVAALGIAIDELVTVLKNESETKILAPLEGRRYAIETLMNVTNLFAPDAFDRLPEIAQYDFKETGRCIAVARSTAAAFHCLRGTESALRAFYRRFIKRGKAKNWGPIVSELRGKRNRPKPDANLLTELDHIRVHYRNPTQHPEKRYDISEAQDLLGPCVSVVNRMAKELPDRERRSGCA